MHTYVHIYIYIYTYIRFSKAQSGKMGPAPGRLEPSKGMLTSDGDGIRDPQIEIVRIGNMITDRIKF